jgi:SAM-dependent methyltransferase
VDIWARCLNCRSLFRDITPSRFTQLRDNAFPDTAPIDTTAAFIRQRPLRELWHELARPGNTVLQIGPGSGHLLAAARRAGCVVAAVEPSKVHRDFIRDVWNIEAVYPSLDAVPAGRDYDTIVATDTLGRAYDVDVFLAAIRRLLAPGGTCYLSAPNARSLAASVLGSRWPACKDAGQAAFPSAAGLTLAARRGGLRVRRIWSAGRLPGRGASLHAYVTRGAGAIVR